MGLVKNTSPMTYSDKKAIDLLLDTTIDVTTKKQDVNSFVVGA